MVTTDQTAGPEPTLRDVLAEVKGIGMKVDIQEMAIRDLMSTMTAMDKRLSSRMDKMDKRMDSQEVRLHEGFEVLAAKIDGVEQRLSSRINDNTVAINALNTAVVMLTERVTCIEEDLNVTMFDTLEIRRHVGMFAGDE